MVPEEKKHQEYGFAFSSVRKARRQLRKRVNLKVGVTRKQSTPNFPKNEYFLLLDMHTLVYVSLIHENQALGRR